ncbi:hypothetical protein [Chryseolinea serpens]|uniref:hypothetical protein n=1 Tax=Chryseolinea serpens TaxID=947013 RepID=UPI000933DD91|nr:hypothetical protein [Chryseolinea serpens]
MNKTLKILVYLKKRSGYTNGPLPVYLRVTFDSQRMEGTTQREMDGMLYDKSQKVLPMMRVN